jgi:plasmid stabilization system protein ParE
VPGPDERLEWSLRAQAHLQEVLAYYLEHATAEAAGRVLRQIETRAFRLAEFPQLGEAIPNMDPSYRRSHVANYTVLYRVVPERSVVRVFAVRHSRRRPLSPAEIAALDVES